MTLLVSDYRGDCSTCGRWMVKSTYPDPLPDLVVRISGNGRCRPCVQSARERTRRANALAKRDREAARHRVPNESLEAYLRGRRARLAQSERVQRVKAAGLLP